MPLIPFFPVSFQSPSLELRERGQKIVEIWTPFSVMNVSGIMRVETYRRTQVIPSSWQRL